MGNIESLQIYRKLSAKALIGSLHDRVRKVRPSVSRNTIHLAFRNGATTPLREMIIELGTAMLESSEVVPAEEPICS